MLYTAVMTDQKHLRRQGGFLMKRLSSLRLELMLLLMVLNVVSIRPSTAESEINDLNTLDAKNQSDMSPTQMSSKLETRQFPPQSGFMPPQPQFPSSSFPGGYGGCPLCDSSVYGYCSHKLIHDSCCCDFPGSIYQKPPHCAYYDCMLLYAKSCYEHSLIKNCCCNNPY